jgi:hypothetical protein
VTDAIVNPLSRRHTIDQLLTSARQRLLRLSPREAAAEQRFGALLVDIRPEAQRGLEGEIPAAS